jgi:hypothetical protein
VKARHILEKSPGGPEIVLEDEAAGFATNLECEIGLHGISENLLKPLV